MGTSALGGNHRQRGTLRFVHYWAAFDEAEPGRAMYFAAFDDGEFGLGGHDAEVTFDPALIAADDAVRDAIGQHIDSAKLAQGAPLRQPHPAVRYW